MIQAKLAKQTTGRRQGALGTVEGTRREV
jgi:hypothetical protein